MSMMELGRIVRGVKIRRNEIDYIDKELVNCLWEACKEILES
jgi:hypothetical protein